MPWGKRRKGKQSSGRSTPVPPPSTPAKEEAEDPTVDEEADKDTDQSSKDATQKPEESAPSVDKESEDSGDVGDDSKIENAEDSVSQQGDNGDDLKKEENEDSIAKSAATQDGSKGTSHELILTSEKRRGVYECDYCHSDISQLPRIRSAVSDDFDLCLDCFATTDHSAAVARLKAAATAHAELKADGIASTMVTGVSSAAANIATHGYRVCDSTRYPVFGSIRQVLKGSITNSITTKAIATPSVTGSEAEEKDDEEPSEKESETSKMDVDEDADPSERTKSGDEDSKADSQPTDTTKAAEYMVVNDDPKSIWTAEEDLRLLDGIKTHGLGNWTDISEAVGGNGSVGKTPKRCMERYFDDFLGRYGHILPQYTIIADDSGDDAADSALEDFEDDSVRARKRRQSQLSRLPSNLSNSSSGGSRSRKRFKVVSTESLPGFDDLWVNPYLPPVSGVTLGKEVARDLSTKNEQTFVKAIAAAATKEEADKIRKEWMEKRLNQIGAPTVLPPRPEDSATLPGADLMGFMPRRGDFDIEYDNEAESALADMEFTTADSEQDKQLKVQVLQIYYQKQEERERRKKFILSRNLYDYRKYVKDEQDLPQDERDLIHRMRLFERFHTPQEHKQFIDDILKAKRLRKEIAKLQMYRRIGIRSLAEAERYELDKSRRQFHKAAKLQKEAEAKQAALTSVAQAATGAIATAGRNTGISAAAMSSASPGSTGAQGSEGGESLWKQYRTSDRKARRSINRSGRGITEEKLDGDSKTASGDGELSTPGAETPEKAASNPEAKEQNKEDGTKNGESKEKEAPLSEKKEEEMDVDEPADDEGSKVAMPEESSETKETADPIGNEEEPEEQGDNEIFDISDARGYDLLSHREVELCLRIKIYPVQYLEIKKALIHEALTKGLLEKEGVGSGRRVVVKMDIERRGNVIDFLLRAGWISSRLAKVARTVTPPTVPPTSSD